MKRIIKRSIALLMCAVLSLALLPPLNVQAADIGSGSVTVGTHTYAYTIKAPDSGAACAVITDYTGVPNGGDYTVNIPKEITHDSVVYPVTTIGASCFIGKDRHWNGTTYDKVFDSIVVPEGVTRIESSAFSSNAWYLISVTLPDTLRYIGDNCFNGSDDFDSITIPANVESIGYGAFYGCRGLRNITFAAGSKMTAIQSGTFYGSGITSIILPAGVTTIETGAFKDCTGLTSVILPDSPGILENPWYTEWGAFQGCTSLSAITIPASVTTIGFSMFNGCSSLQSVTFVSGNTLKVIRGYAFLGCQNLTSITLPNSLTEIGGAAFLGSGLTAITLPAGVTTLQSETFRWCGALETVSFAPGSTLTSIAYARVFDHCKKLSSVNLPEGIKTITANAFSDTPALTSIVIPAGVTTLETNAFDGDDDQTADVTEIGGLTGAFFLGAPPATFGTDVFYSQPPGFRVYYHLSKEADWASFNSYNKAPFVMLTLKLYDSVSAAACAPVDEFGHIAAPAAPERSGYTLEGWYTDEDRTIPFDTGSTVMTGDMTLYAKWEESQAAPPVISSVEPNTGSASGGTSVTLTGTGFTGATVVNFGLKAVSNLTVVSSSEISVISPKGPAGSTVPVTVTTSNGTSNASLFTYTAEPAPVGSIRASFSGNVISGWLLKAWSVSKSSGAAAVLSQGTADYLLTGLAPASDYTVRIQDLNGLTLCENKNVTVTQDHTTDIALAPVASASLAIRVLSDEGTPLSGIRVVVNDAVSGAYLAGAYSGSDGKIADIPYLSGKSVSIKMLANTKPYYNKTQIVQSLAAGSSTIDVTLDALPASSAAGTVTDSNNNPVSGGLVTAVQQADGRRWTFTAVTGANGGYILPLLQGDAVMDAAAPGSIVQRSVKGVSVTNITAVGITQNFVLPRVTEQGEITVMLYTGANGQNYTLQPMDTVVSAHYRVRAFIQSDGKGYSGYPLKVRGLQGDTVTVTADGSEAGMSAQSVEVTLDANGNAVAELRLDEIAVVTGSVLWGSTGSKTGLWDGVLFQMVGGRKQWVQDFSGADGDFSIPITEPGEYIAQVYAGNYSGGVSFNITGGEQKSIGSISLSQPGNFTGTPGNSITITPDETVQGGVLTVTAAYRSSTLGTVDDAAVLIDIPAGTALVGGSLKLNGQSVTPQITADSAVLTVPLPVLTGFQSGFVSFQLKLDGDYEALETALSADIRYSVAGTPRIETLGVCTALVSGVRLLVASSRTSLRTMTVCGYAPPDSRVTLYDGTTAVGSANAGSANGYFTITFELADTGGIQEQHLLVAKAENGGSACWSDEVPLLFDPFEPQLTQITAKQYDGRVYSFDPRSGVNTSPFVYYPGMPMVFSITFDKPENVYDVQLLLENGGQAAALYDTISGKFVATLYPDRSPGSVYVVYKTRIGESDLPLLSYLKSGETAVKNQSAYKTEAVLRSELHPAVSDYVVDEMTFGDENTASTDTTLGTVTATLPQLNNLKVKTTFTASGEEYEPTAAERAFVKETGLPVFGMTSTTEEKNGHTIITGTMYIPASKEDFEAAMAGDPGVNYITWATEAWDTAAGLVGRAKQFYNGSELLQEGAKVVTNANTVRTTEKKMLDEWSGKDNWGKLDATEAYLKDHPGDFSDDERAMFQKEFDSMRDKMLGKELGSFSFDSLTAGGVFTTATVYTGTAAVTPYAVMALGASWVALDRINSNYLDSLMDRLRLRSDIKEENHIWDLYKQSDQFDKENHLGKYSNKNRIDEVKDDKWIADPSGYVYEALEMNRLSGVTATVMRLESGVWVAWDPAEYGQENPLLTDQEGRYGWDVPDGQYKVVYSKDGYETAESDVVTIPPIRTDLNIGLMAKNAPTVVGVTAGTTSIDIEFSQYMRCIGLDGSISVVGSDDIAVPGKITPMTAGISPGGVPLALSVRFTPSAPFTAGQTYSVSVNTMPLSYTGMALAGFNGSIIPGAPSTPVVTSVSRGFGPETGGTLLGISGSGFTDAIAVDFGGSATGFTVLSDRLILAVSPAGSGSVDITVLNGAGSSTLTAGYTYYSETVASRPLVKSISPDNGTSDGGTPVTITGSGFSGTTGVCFGGFQAASFTVVSDTAITAVSPVGRGDCDVTVRTAAGVSIGLSSTYSYLAAAAVSAGQTEKTLQTSNATLTVPADTFRPAQTITLSDEGGSSFTVPPGYILVGNPVQVSFDRLPTVPLTLSIRYDALKIPAGYTASVYLDGRTTALTSALGLLEANTDITMPGLYAILARNASEAPGGGGGAPASAGVLGDFSKDADVIVNGVTYRAGEEASATVGGKTTITVTIDTARLNDVLDTEGMGALVVIPINGDYSAAKSVLDSQMVKALEENGATLELRTEQASYLIPASLLEIDARRAQFGGSATLGNIGLSLVISEPSGQMASVIENTAVLGGFSVVVPAVDFSVMCTCAGQTSTLTDFSSYVTRRVAIPDGFDLNSVTTAVTVDENGNVRPLPTKLVVIDGVNYAQFVSLANSTDVVISNNTKFSDVSGHWAEAVVNGMGSRLIVSGTGGGRFAPDLDMTRAEFASIIVHALGIAPKTGESSFSDVKTTAWYCGYIEAAYQYGLVKGNSDSTFGPNVKISREQAMAITERVMRFTGLDISLKDDVKAILSAFTDEAVISDYARQSVAVCINAGIIFGKNSRTLAPQDDITRAEVAAIVQRLLQKSGLI